MKYSEMVFANICRKRGEDSALCLTESRDASWLNKCICIVIIIIVIIVTISTLVIIIFKVPSRYITL